MHLLNMTVEIRQESIGWRKGNGIGKGPWAGNQTTYRHAVHWAIVSELHICVVGTTVQLSTCNVVLVCLKLWMCNKVITFLGNSHDLFVSFTQKWKFCHQLNYSPSCHCKPVIPLQIFSKIKIFCDPAQTAMQLPHSRPKITTLFNNLFSYVSVFDTHLIEYHNIRMPVTVSRTCGVILSWMRDRDWHEREKCWIKLLLFSLYTTSILVASKHYGWTTDVTWTILTMSLLTL